MYIDALVLRDRSDGGSLNERLHAVQDANWNSVAIADTAGAVKERYAYTPFGVVNYMDASWNPLTASGYAWTVLFQGMRYESMSGLYPQRMRWYNPLLGSWASRDSIRYSAGVNFYQCLGNNPIKTTDPSGLIDPKP